MTTTTAATGGQQWNSDIRDWNAFLSGFSTPEDVQKLQERVQFNLKFFYANYALLLAAVFVVCCVSSPKLGLAAAVSAALTFAVFQVPDGTALFAQVTMTTPLKQLSALVVVVSALYLTEYVFAIVVVLPP